MDSVTLRLDCVIAQADQEIFCMRMVCDKCVHHSSSRIINISHGVEPCRGPGRLLVSMFLNWLFRCQPEKLASCWMKTRSRLSLYFFHTLADREVLSVILCQGPASVNYFIYLLLLNRLADFDFIETRRYLDGALSNQWVHN